MPDGDRGLERARCRGDGCGAEILWGRTRAGARIPLDVRSEKRAVVHLVPIRNLAGETTGTDWRVVMEDTFTPHHATCPAVDQFRHRRPEVPA